LCSIEKIEEKVLGGALDLASPRLVPLREVISGLSADPNLSYKYYKVHRKDCKWVQILLVSLAPSCAIF
jgi:hypothetical protein